jgi:hypothetical protein
MAQQPQYIGLPVNLFNAAFNMLGQLPANQTRELLNALEKSFFPVNPTPQESRVEIVTADQVPGENHDAESTR